MWVPVFFALTLVTKSVYAIPVCKTTESVAVYRTLRLVPPHTHPSLQDTCTSRGYGKAIACYTHVTPLSTSDVTVSLVTSQTFDGSAFTDDTRHRNRLHSNHTWSWKVLEGSTFHAWGTFHDWPVTRPFSSQTFGEGWVSFPPTLELHHQTHAVTYTPRTPLPRAAGGLQSPFLFVQLVCNNPLAACGVHVDVMFGCERHMTCGELLSNQTLLDMVPPCHWNQDEDGSTLPWSVAWLWVSHSPLVAAAVRVLTLLGSVLVSVLMILRYALLELWDTWICLTGRHWAVNLGVWVMLWMYARVAWLYMVRRRISTKPTWDDPDKVC